MQKNIRRKPNKMKTKLNVQINDIVKTRKGDKNLYVDY